MLSVELRVLLGMLVTFRLAELIAIDQITQPLRQALGRKATYGGFWKWLADLFHCPFCVGVWIGFGVTFLIVYPTFIGDFFLIFLGITGMQALLENFFYRRE